MIALVLLLVFVATILVTVGVYAFFNRRRLATADAAVTRLTVVEEERRIVNILKTGEVGGFALLRGLFTGRPFTEQLTTHLRRAGIALAPATLIQVCVAASLSGLVLGIAAGKPALGVMGLALGVLVPVLWIRRKRRKRLSAFQAQLPDAIDMLVSAMKAGYSFQAAMNFIGQEVNGPLGPEFARFYDEQRLGIDVRTALLSLQERMDSMDLKMFVTAVLVQREAGGNLGEVLANISDIMRERFAIEGELETLTSESRLSARILGLLPLVVFLSVLVLNPSFMQPMLAQRAGQAMLLIAAGAVTAGYFVMMKIARVDV
jgi:tight adherence protein B